MIRPERSFRPGAGFSAFLKMASEIPGFLRTGKKYRKNVVLLLQLPSFCPKLAKSGQS
jgi:hypothetical protein